MRGHVSSSVHGPGRSGGALSDPTEREAAPSSSASTAPVALLDVLERHLDLNPTGERDISGRHLVSVLERAGQRMRMSSAR